MEFNTNQRKVGIMKNEKCTGSIACVQRMLNTVYRGCATLLMLTLSVNVTNATTWYVSTNGNDNATGADWDTAFRTIQKAIDIAPAGSEIVVSNGTYAPISTDNKTITIRSVNGAETTIIDGDGKYRCVTVGIFSSRTNTVLIGFTLQNGYTTGDGGGAAGGTLYDCVLTNNIAARGGGVCHGLLFNCTLENNTARGYGGGAYWGTLNNCTLTGNRATYAGVSGSAYGGGTYNSTLNNCILAGNVASTSGTRDPSHAYGGGAYGGVLNNCTLVGNTASLITYVGQTYSTDRTANGGGVYGGTLNNCIVWGNSFILRGTGHNHINCTFSYSCTTPSPGGTGNITSDPLFMDFANGDYRLKPHSPCVNKGSNALAVGDTDVEGNPRIIYGTVDMGAYESVVMPYNAWLDYYETGHSLVNTNKWLMGLDPHDVNAAFLATIEMQDGKPYVGWIPNLRGYRSYTVETKVDLSDRQEQWQDVAPKDVPSLPPTSSRFFRVRVTLP